EGVPVVAHRGPYTIAVTYTIQRQLDGDRIYWEVKSFSYIEPPPAWE
ncbi:MAG: hypothetical protein IH586_01185, partial [Anaerolineaceae bacterium]|nr:hypothetical protein [Anaerolineaceae bacterium]